MWYCCHVLPLLCRISADWSRSASFLCPAGLPRLVMVHVVCLRVTFNCCCTLRTSSHSSVPQHLLPKSVAPRKTYREREPPPSPRTPLGSRLSTFRSNIVVTLRVETSNPNWIYRSCRRRYNCISIFRKRLSIGAESYSRRTVASRHRTCTCSLHLDLMLHQWRCKSWLSGETRERSIFICWWSCVTWTFHFVGFVSTEQCGQQVKQMNTEQNLTRLRKGRFRQVGTHVCDVQS